MFVYAGTSQEICTDGIDNDNDGYIDCSDTECACYNGGVLQPTTFNTEQRLKIENNLLIMRPHLSSIRASLEDLREKYKRNYPIEANWAGVLATKIYVAETYIDELLDNGKNWPDSKYYSTIKTIKDQLNDVIAELNSVPLEHEDQE